MSTLQELLNLGLVDIGSEDSRFEKVQSIATELAAKLKAEPDLLIPATLIAIDNEADEDIPLFILVEKLLIVEWQTLRNTHVNRPRELLRSIIIDALMTSTEENPEVAAVVYNTAIGLYKFGQARLGKEVAVIERLLKDAGRTAEAEAVKRVGLIPPIKKKRRRKKSALQTPLLKSDSIIKDEEVLADIERASGPHNAQSVAGKDPNPHWTNAAHPWSYEFAPRMATALAKAVNLGSQRLSASLSKRLATYLDIVEKRLSDEVRQAEQLCLDMSVYHNSSRMRLDVLWWAEALYSPLLGCSYRDLELADIAVTAAIDLATIVPALSPASVYYVLGEMVHRLRRIQGGDSVSPLTFYLDELTKTQTNFGEALHPINENPPSSLLDLVGETSSKDKQPGDKLLEHTNLDGSLELSFGEFAMWIFRDLQAKRLVEALRS